MTPDRDTPSATDDTVIRRGPTLSLAEAVTATQLSKSTLQRRLRAGELEGATRTRSGGWSIPIRSLIGAGLMPNSTPPDPIMPTPSVTASAPMVDPVVAELRAELEVTRTELEAAKRLADERAERITDLRTALEAMARALPPAPTAPTPATVTRGHWWNRKRTDPDRV